ncbi:hypothetical protein EOD41_12495 [Mucilaginibacter limnophilus]|uniref:Uncharacterized protein n=1 Tax=Mucilaginibacter limnophilus TaxID=1932778 RepID=A0A437MRL4_9SPHI|nr:hypothetical protein [Mucilaginibacter limnophilus]RVU00297.1 hypothetical protein EOD41_12495 [Mucilaginibacter limnophilus]
MENFTKAHWIFYAYVLILFCSAAAEKLGHFYPSLVFPSFSNAPDIRHKAEFPVAGIFGITSNGSKVKLDEEQLFYNLYPKHKYYVLKTIASKINNNEYSEKEIADLKKYLTKCLNRQGLNNFKSLIIVQGNRTYNMISSKVDHDFSNPVYTNIVLF